MKLVRNLSFVFFCATMALLVNDPVRADACNAGFSGNGFTEEDAIEGCDEFGHEYGNEHCAGTCGEGWRSTGFYGCNAAGYSGGQWSSYGYFVCTNNPI